MSSPVQVALAGIAGFGESYVQALLEDPRRAGVEVVAFADPAPQRSRWLPEIQRRGIPIHPSLEHALDAHRVELALIAAPIHLHASQTLLALRRGASVLCEKPIAGNVADGLAMVAAQRQHPGRFVGIGYQWAFSVAMQKLKRDILAGDLGRPVRMRSLTLFPRDSLYFHRNDWAGRFRSRSGAVVNDSPLNNATAHYLQILLYLLGREAFTSAQPRTVEAELARANDIETFDTASLRVVTDGGVEVLYYSSHATPARLGPDCTLEFEHATVTYRFANAGAELVAAFDDGTVRRYGDPNHDRNLKIWDAVASVRTGEPLACDVEAALPHALCVAAADRSMPEVTVVPRSHRVVHASSEGQQTVVRGLHEALLRCFERGQLPSESGALDWARPGRVVSVDRDLVSAPSAPLSAAV
jgi:predicted dehydrogenase